MFYGPNPAVYHSRKHFIITTSLTANTAADPHPASEGLPPSHAYSFVLCSLNLNISRDRAPILSPKKCATAYEI